MNEITAILGIICAVLGAGAAYLTIRFLAIDGHMQALSAEIQSLRSELAQSMIEKAKLRDDLKESAKREATLQEALNQCMSMHGGS